MILTEEAKRKEDKLLKVSDFLNQFQSHFLPGLTKNGPSNDESNGEATKESTKIPLGKITTQDLEDALGFRSLLERLRILEEEKFVANHYGRSEVKSEPLIRQIVAHKNEELENIQKEIQEIPDRMKLVLSVLRRCEVWTSKMVAQDQLVTAAQYLPESSRTKTDHCCFSPFINIPTSKYFANRLSSIVVENKEQGTLSCSTTEGEAENNCPPCQSSIPAFHRKNKCGQCCTLALPPNRHTWQAYARLAIMASLVGDGDSSNSRKELSLRRCLKSPSCVYDLNRHKKGKNPLHNHQYSFSPKSDLVPLWLRAQRNTRALRQLILLFEVKREMQMPGPNDADRGKQGVFDAVSDTNATRGKHLEMDQSEIDLEEGEEETDKGDTGRFKAIFRGNPMNVRARVMEVSEHVDRLIEWAVVNQSLFTYRHVRKHLLAPLSQDGQQKSTRKRRRESDDYPEHTILAKKIFCDVNEKENLFELHQACQSYLLRWFARRNRDALTIIFSKRIEKMSFDVGCSMNTKVLSQAKLLRDDGVLSRVQDYMEQWQTGYPEDRTLSRIDRRLFIKDRYNGTSAVTCQFQVSNLMHTLSKSCPGNQNCHQKLVDAAINDFKDLFQTFYPTTIDESNRDEVYHAASKLVAPSEGCTVSSLTHLLKDAPAPWAENCCECKKAGPADLLTCYNCERVFHEKCSSSSSGSNGTNIALKDFIKAFPPLHDLFKLKQPKNLTYPDFSMSENQWIKKTIQIDRQIEGDGKVGKLGISFDHTEDCLQVLEAIESDACSLAEILMSNQTNIRGNNPLIPARIISKGCLITNVHDELCGGKSGLLVGDIIIGVEVLKYAHTMNEQNYAGQHKFDMADLSNEDRLALLKVESLKLNLVILRPLVNLVEIATTWYNSTKQINKNVLDALLGMDTLRPWYCGYCIGSRACNESESVFLEASSCRAVVRRIGMESYSQPFRESNQEHQSDHFSLRRLDSIMTHIMRVESNNKFYDLAPESFFAPSLPSSVNCTSPQRLSWATEPLERRPLELLCKAMKALVNSKFSGQSHIDTQRNGLLCHFLLAFGSWCVGGTVKSHSYSALIGPPKIFQCSRAPWLGATCSVCFSQPAASEKICNNQLCLNTSYRAGQRIVKKSGHFMNDYSKNASLVGKSFLVLPSDPLVEYVSRIVHIEHENRPVEFIVASYLPSDYHNEVVNGRQKDHGDCFGPNDSIYHLLPVVSSRQQNFLLERCKIRNEDMITNSGCHWTSLDVLNLDGVARYSPAALQNKMKESSEIRLAMDHAIIEQVCNSSSIPQHAFKQVSSQYKLAVTDLISSKSDIALEIQDKLLDTLLEGKATLKVVRGLLSAHINHDQIDMVVGEADWSDWKIIQREENSQPLQFGLTCCQPGLLPISPVRASWKILKLQNISEDNYSMYYSDFLFQDEVGKQDLNRKLHPLNISPPLPPQEGSLKFFALSPEEPNCMGNNMFGLGFEILRWANEHILRVGRVRHGSPAYKAGLKTHDIVKAINGVHFTWFQDIVSLVSSVLGASNIKVRMPENLDRIGQISILLSTIKSARIKLSPVTFNIFQPTSIGHQSIPPETTVPRSTSPTQHPCQEHHVPPQRDTNRGNSQSRPLPSHHEAMVRNIHSMNQVLQMTYSKRPQIQKCDFYRPAKNGTILTILEVSVFLESLMNQTWKLGVRLLMPRYEIQTIGQQIKAIFSWPAETFEQIPVVKGRFYQHILNLDFERMRCTKYPEEGQIILTEQKDGREYEYKYPKRPLPIDRSIEISFDDHYRQQQQQYQHHNQQQHHQYQHHHQQQQQQQFQHQQQQQQLWHLYQSTYQRYNNNNYQHTRIHHGPSHTISFQKYSSGGHGINISPQDTSPQHQGSPSSSHAQVQTSRVVPSQHDGEIQNHNVVDLVDDDDSLPGTDDFALSADTLSADEPGLSIYTNETNQQKHIAADPKQTNGTDDFALSADTLSADEPGLSIYTNETNQQKHIAADPKQTNGTDDFALSADTLSADEPGLSIYTKKTNQQKHTAADPKQTNGVSSQSSSMGQYNERIRGGGSSEADEPNDSAIDNQSNYLYLCDVPQNQWKGIAVYIFVQTASKGSVCDDALLVGFARRCIELDSCDEDQVEIEAYYVSGTGYLEKTKMHQSYSDEVWVVDTNGDSEEARVIAELRSKNKLPHDYHEESQRATLRGSNSDNFQQEDEQKQDENILDIQGSQTPGPGGQLSCVDALRLEFDQTSYSYVCEEQQLGMKPSVGYHSGCHECSLCSLPLERCLVCKQSPEPTKKSPCLRSLGCTLMSDIALTEDPSQFDMKIPGQLGKGKTLLLKIARLIPASLKIQSKGVGEWHDPLHSFRVFDNETNYAVWKDFVAECTCTEMLAQALVALLASIQRTKLPKWWSHKDAGWSAPYATLAELSLSALYLQIYVLDTALTDIISRSLKEKSASRNNKFGNANAVQIQERRMKKYWELAMTQGYNAYEGSHKDNCYHCNNGGHLLCCELCPNAQHHECCDPKLTSDVKLDRWLCDSCIDDIENYGVDEDFEEYQEDEELSS